MKKSQLGKFGRVKNPFEIEELRTKFSINEDFVNFKKTYSSKFPEVKALNTNAFWNKKFHVLINYADLDLMTQKKIDTIISLIPDKENKILDIGMGQGYLEQRLQQLGRKYDIFGIDISKKAIERAKKNFMGHFKKGDALAIKRYYNKNSFDVITAIELIEHISPRKILTFYKDIYSLLKPDGIFLISTPLNECLRYMNTNPSSHVREYTEPILRMEFQISGFKVVDEKFFFAFKNSYQLKTIISRVFPNRWKPNNIVMKLVKK